MSIRELSQAEQNDEEQLREMNESLLVSSLRQNELADQAQQSLDFAEATLRTSPVPLLVLESDLRVVTANEAFYHKFQVQPEDTEGRPIYELGIGQWNIPQLRELLEEILPRRKWLEQYEVTHDFERIGARTMLLSARRMAVNEAGLKRIVMVIEDITERKGAEEALRRSEERYRALASVITDVPWTTDPTGAFVTPQEAYSRYTGKSWEELRGFGWAECIHPDDRDRLVAVWNEAVARRTPTYNAPCRQWHGPTQQWRHVIARGTPVLNADGSVREWVGSLTDVHEQTLADADRARLAAIVTFSEDAIISKDLDGVITSWNDGAEHLFGYTAQEAVGQSVTMLIPADHIDEEPKIIARIKRGEAVDHYETVRRRKDGTLLDISLTVSPLRDASGRIVGASKVARDITEQKQAQAQLKADLADTRLLQDISAELIRGENGTTLNQKIIDAAVAIMRSDFASMQMLYPERGQGGELHLLAFHGFNPQAARFWEWVRADSNCTCGVALKTHQRVIAPDVENCDFLAGTDDQATYLQTGIRAVQSTPLISRGGTLVGMISTHWNKPHQPSERELRLLDILARQAADLLERKQAEQQLRRNADTLQALIEQSPLGIYTVDSRFRIAQISAGAEPAFRNMQPVIGRDFAEVMRAIWPEPFAGKAIAIFRHTLETGEPYVSPGLTEKRHDTGTVESYEWQINRVTLADGKQGVVCYFFDTTRIKQAEETLRESEERFRTLADNIAQLAWTCDSLGNVTWYNQRWLDYTGLSFEEMKGWDWSKVQHPEHLERVVQRVKRSAETGETWEDTFPLRGKDGEYRWFLSRAVPIRDEAGNIVRWFGTNTDVTEQREMAEELGRNAASMAEVDRRKDEFLAMLSHELRNPLAPISNALQLLRAQKDEDPLQQQARSIIERQVGQLTRLVNDLLEVSRITTGRIHLHLERVTLNGIVTNAVETVRPLIGQRRHALQVAISAEPIQLHGDASRLEQVVVNLLTNAAKYTEEGGRIFLSAQQEGEQAVLRVRDTGVGIAPDVLPRIFDLFTQADRSLDRSQGGLGIGLCLVQRLVDLHQGRVEASSILGQGSEFVVRLPIAPSFAPEASPTQEKGNAAGKGCRVLVVDDNLDAAQTLSMLLKATGYEVRAAYDGPAALDAALDFRPAVMLLDIGLPRMDGYEVAKRLRQQADFKDVILVAMTGYGQESDRQRSREAGFDHHLVKPADFAKVRQILAEAVEGASSPSRI